jgi:DNA gyrase inhibitor GyrI
MICQSIKFEEMAMNNPAGPALSVSIRDLLPVEVAYARCRVEQSPGRFSDQIRDGFQVVKDWAAQKGFDISLLKVVGIPQVSNGQMASYDCCIELPEPVDVSEEAIQSKQLTGGRYAVLTLEKDSATIGETIGRFFAEYVPEHELVIDNNRPNYEIYYENLLDFCVPII